MGYSINEFTYDGTDVFDLNFALGYASRGDVSAYIDGETPVSLDFDWLDDFQVQLSAGHTAANGDTIVFARTVSKTSLPVDITMGGQATRENLEDLSVHVMYIQHEILDGRISDSLVIGDIVLQAVEDAVNQALENLSISVQQFEQLFFSFYNTYDGQIEYIVTAAEATCQVQSIQVDVQTNPNEEVEFLLTNDGEVKATITIGTDGTVTRAIPAGGSEFTLTAGLTTCEINGNAADASLECGITVIGAVDVSSITV